MFSAVEVLAKLEMVGIFPFLACDCILLQVKPKQGIKGGRRPGAVMEIREGNGKKQTKFHACVDKNQEPTSGVMGLLTGPHLANTMLVA